MLLNPETSDQLIIAVSMILVPILLISLKKRSLKPMGGALSALFLVYFFVQPLIDLIVDCYPLASWFDQFMHGCYVFGVYYDRADVVTAIVSVLAMLAGALWGMSRGLRKPKAAAKL